MKLTEMYDTYKVDGLVGLYENFLKEESTEEEYNKEIKKAQDKSEGKEKTEVSKAAVQAVEIQKEDVELDEKELTKDETSEKEKVVKGMKKNIKGFREKYGDDAENVMYATATKIAKEKD